METEHRIEVLKLLDLSAVPMMITAGHTERALKTFQAMVDSAPTNEALQSANQYLQDGGSLEDLVVPVSETVQTTAAAAAPSGRRNMVYPNRFFEL